MRSKACSYILGNILGNRMCQTSTLTEVLQQLQQDVLLRGPLMLQMSHPI